ncbi:ABC transporter ATP-binding protein [Bremerella cremea]|uniref:ABC transporter ATP-binding protein n=1 Tax=Bremerella cremea TaxID=1031537 RepID=A0A368KKL9_9BACT|nr:ABC transporter ATP-binding protein [Bremerella cremea]RCS41318.1 ABC transporter ATP-binding protein [Bremerella cremea]
MPLKAKQLSFRYGTHPILQDIDFQATPGITALIGPNAAGKSTLLKCLCGVLRPEGEVELDGKSIASWTHQQVTAQISYLPQAFAPQAALTVFETVLLGRLPHLRWKVAPEDLQIVEQALGELELSMLAERRLNQLSGGQVQAVAICQALVRHPKVLLMDEPTSNLDLRRQFDVIQYIQASTQRDRIATVVALHDLNLAARFADQVYVLHQGQLHSHGKPKDVLTPKMIAQVYGVEARVVEDEGELLINFLGPTNSHCNRRDTRE